MVMAALGAVRGVIGKINKLKLSGENTVEADKINYLLFK